MAGFRVERQVTTSNGIAPFPSDFPASFARKQAAPQLLLRVTRGRRASRPLWKRADASLQDIRTQRCRWISPGCRGDHDGGSGAGGFAVALLPQLACVLAPAKTPAPIIERLSVEIRRAVDDPEFQKEIDVLGAIPCGTTPQDAQTFLASEPEKWGKVIKASGVTAE